MMSPVKDSSGFTLLELLVTTAIAIALGAGGFAFFANQTRSLADQSATLDAAESARAALDFMGKDIRTAGANPAGAWVQSANSCDTGLSAARTNNITIRADSNGDGTPESTTYSYDSGSKSIRRTDTNGATETLISNVTSFNLRYYAGSTERVPSGSPAQVTTAYCDTVTTVLLAITVQNPKTNTVNQMNLSTRVALRNRTAVLKRL